ncbi:MAG: hypothetical protein NC336_05230 [Clostridium sp.]|nr:hypothetical protein [Clostridium sp.]
MSPVRTEIYKTDASALLRYYSRRWLTRLLPWLLAGFVAVVAAGYFDLRYALAAAMLVAVLFPIAWLLTVNRLLSMSTSLAAPRRLSFDSDGTLTVELFRTTKDDEGDIGFVADRQSVYNCEEYSVERRKRLYIISIPDGVILLPDEHLVAEPKDPQSR